MFVYVPRHVLLSHNPVLRATKSVPIHLCLDNSSIPSKNTQKEPDPSVTEQQGKTGFMNTTVYSLGKTSIRKVYQETRYSRSVMSPVHVIMHGDWTLYWRLTLKVKRKECYIFVSYRKVLPPIDSVK